MGEAFSDLAREASNCLDLDEIAMVKLGHGNHRAGWAMGA